METNNEKQSPQYILYNFFVVCPAALDNINLNRTSMTFSDLSGIEAESIENDAWSFDHHWIGHVLMRWDSSHRRDSSAHRGWATSLHVLHTCHGWQTCAQVCGSVDDCSIHPLWNYLNAVNETLHSQDCIRSPHVHICLRQDHLVHFAKSTNR